MPPRQDRWSTRRRVSRHLLVRRSAVLHSALAVVSLQLRQRKHTCLRAMQQCDKAQLENNPSSDEQAFVLMTTVFLVSFSSLRGDFVQATFFSHHGLRLYSNCNFRERASIRQLRSPSKFICINLLVSLLDHLALEHSWSCPTCGQPARAHVSNTSGRCQGDFSVA